MASKRGTTLDSLLSSFPTREFESSDEFTWDVIGSTRQNIPLVEARDENGVVVTATSGNVGAGTAPFELVFSKDWFAKGEHSPSLFSNYNEKQGKNGEVLQIFG